MTISMNGTGSSSGCWTKIADKTVLIMKPSYISYKGEYYAYLHCYRGTGNRIWTDAVIGIHDETDDIEMVRKDDGQIGI